MSRISTKFEQLSRQSRKALIPFITAGDPALETSLALMHAMVDAGADIIELGVPFSDPMAEGPVIQAACERALLHHVSLRDVLALVREFRQKNDETPVILMGYLNPVEVMGYLEFSREAQRAGVDGVLIVDLPPEEAQPLLQHTREHGLDTVFLVAPTTTAERIKQICAESSGFVYYVSLKGVTGAGHLDVNSVGEKIAELRQYCQLPVGVGFGIKDAASAARVAGLADAVVVGSAIVKLIEESGADTAQACRQVSGLLSAIRQAIDLQGEESSQRA